MKLKFMLCCLMLFAIVLISSCTDTNTPELKKLRQEKIIHFVPSGVASVDIKETGNDRLGTSPGNFITLTYKVNHGVDNDDVVKEIFDFATKHGWKGEIKELESPNTSRSFSPQLEMEKGDMRLSVTAFGDLEPVSGGPQSNTVDLQLSM